MAAVCTRVHFVAMGVVLLATAYKTYAWDIPQHELLARIEALELQGRQQAKVILTQDEALNQMQVQMEIQKDRLNSQEQTIEGLKHTVASLEQFIEKLMTAKDKNNGDSPRNMERALQAQLNHEFEKEGNRIRQLAVYEGPVAFHAVIAKHAAINHIGVGQKIVFPDVMINLGGGYRNNSGLFVAPQSGLYIFSTSIISAADGHAEAFVNVMKDGVLLACAYGHSDSGRHDQGSVTVVTQLAAGNEVWVNLGGNPDTSLWGNYFDSFTGLLVIPMS